jgi:6,7-dimethyl-8-ribityllumazine synthase
MDMAGVRQAAHHVEPREDARILIVEARFCDDIADGVPKGTKAAVALGCVIRAVDGSL